MMKGARSGFTLVEAMLAGAITVLAMLALMEGLIVSAKISHENSELLAADALAWDIAWKWLNKSYEELPAVAGGGRTYQVVVEERSGVQMDSEYGVLGVSTNDCPELIASKAGGDPRIVVRVVFHEGVGRELPRHGTNVKAKRIDVDVEWGSDGARKCLNGLREAGIASYNHPVSVYKSQIDRGTLE